MVCALCYNRCFSANNSLELELSDDEVDLLRLLTLKVEDHLSDKTFDRLRFVFHREDIPMFKGRKARLRFLSAFLPVPYDCCINSCCCYTAHLAPLTACPYCEEARFDARGRPRKRFTYLSFTPRLLDFLRDASMAEKMTYRGKFKHDPACTTDLPDGAHYQNPTKTNVTINGKTQRYKYFEDPRDIALGFSTDGFAPFRKRKHTAWPALLLFNYNLPPEIRFLLRYVLCIGVIPGPKKPKDFDSSFWPAFEEFVKLLSGVKAWD